VRDARLQADDVGFPVTTLVGVSGAAVTPRPPLLHRVTPYQLQVVDVVIGVLLALIGAGHAARIGPVAGPGHGRVVAAAVWIAVGASIAVRRRQPFASLVLMTAAVAAATAAGAVAMVPAVLVALPLYQVASLTPRGHSLPILGGELLALAVITAASRQPGHGAEAGAAVVAVAAWFVGDSVRVRRLYVAGLAEQAAQRQREALERAQRFVAEERLQIARELHDVLAHSLSVITIQSGVGRHVIDTNPTEAKRALTAAEETGRAALGELRRMLGVLRGDASEPAERAPAPGIAGLPRLAEQMTAAGIPVALELRSELAASLSPSAELSVYRIVQEALTNVVKHAGPASVRVELRDEPGALVLEVLDDGLGAAGVPRFPDGQGDATAHHGIVGMRERVALFGGSLAAGPRPERGFQVLARFPVERGRQVIGGSVSAWPS
jgi:signal transduction histidine kinase